MKCGHVLKRMRFKGVKVESRWSKNLEGGNGCVYASEKMKIKEIGSYITLQLQLLLKKF